MENYGGTREDGRCFYVVSKRQHMLCITTWKEAMYDRHILCITTGKAAMYDLCLICLINAANLRNT